MKLPKLRELAIFLFILSHVCHDSFSVLKESFFFQTVMAAAENGASDCLTQSVPPAGNIERQHGSSEKIGIETQHALYSLAQMRDFQTLNLKKRVSLR